MDAVIVCPLPPATFVCGGIEIVTPPALAGDDATVDRAELRAEAILAPSLHCSCEPVRGRGGLEQLQHHLNPTKSNKRHARLIKSQCL